MSLINTFDDSAENTDHERLLCAKVGKALSNSYSEWHWQIEVPPNQNLIIIRNLDLLSLDNKPFCMAAHRDKVDNGDLEITVVLMAGEMLERYEHIRSHFGKFTPRDVEERQQLIVAPED